MWPLAQQTAANPWASGVNPELLHRVEGEVGHGWHEGGQAAQGSGPMGPGSLLSPARGPFFQRDSVDQPMLVVVHLATAVLRGHVTKGCYKFRIAFKWIFILLITTAATHF